jgi:tetratricopeptide (TPR) repeat protein
MRAPARLIRHASLLALILLTGLCVHCANTQERINSARLFMKEWNYDRALTELISFRKDKNAEIQYLLGYCYLKKNEFGEALNYFGQSLVISEFFKDSIVDAYNTLAQNALRIDEPERALFLYGEVAKLVPTYDQANNLLLIGDLHFEKGNYPAALEAYTRAFDIDSTSDIAQEVMPRFITSLKECNMLERAFELATRQYEALKTAANLLLVSEIRFAIGTQLFNEGRIDSARMYFEMIIANNDPKSLIDDAYFYLGEIFYQQNNFTAALDAYKKVLRLNPYEKGDIIIKTKERIDEIKEIQ